ncbi:MAG TPA: TadE family type IV pilus minor pilin [Lacisediminihabitans sp.]|uniref:TadE family type IV pilus minor pilin n=1 Tax=Lacisediminihabitans sp. TaxID=2787631 RepID=UPI002ED837F7
MTAEFAAVVPAVMLVLVCCLGGMQLAGEQLRLQDAAANAARAASRGDGLDIASQIVPGARLATQRREGIVCVRAEIPAAIAGGLLGSIGLAASSCAAAGP